MYPHGPHSTLGMALLPQFQIQYLQKWTKNGLERIITGCYYYDLESKIIAAFVTRLNSRLCRRSTRALFPNRATGAPLAFEWQGSTALTPQENLQ